MTDEEKAVEYAENKYYYRFPSETTRLWDYSRCYVIKYNWTNTLLTFLDKE